jgi:TatD DNase family protein
MSQIARRQNTAQLAIFKLITAAHLCPVLLNLHTHRPTAAPDVLEIESVYFGQAQTPFAPARSVGLHPWFLEKTDFGTAADWLRGQAAAPAVLAIGEAGLDKATSTSWPLQLLGFQRCVEISEEFQKPLVIHCVRAFAEIIDLKKQWKPAQPWIFHGFDKNLETAQMLLRADCHLSFGAAIFKEKNRAAEALRDVPAERFFLETDAADLPIQAVYARAAALRGTTEADLEKQIWANFERLFSVAKA